MLNILIFDEYVFLLLKFHDYLYPMSYKVIKFEVEYKKEIIPISVHVVTEGTDTSHIVSLDDHENFEIKSGESGDWYADDRAEINQDLLELITDQYKRMQP